MIGSSGSYKVLSNSSLSLDNSYLFRHDKIATSLSHPSYISYWFWLCCARSILNGSRSRRHNLLTSDVMQTVAALGAEYMSANSPKSAPDDKLTTLVPFE